MSPMAKKEAYVLEVGERAEVKFSRSGASDLFDRPSPFLGVSVRVSGADWVYAPLTEEDVDELIAALTRLKEAGK